MLFFLLKALFLSMSGVLAPGPLTTMVVSQGNKAPHAGALVAAGHGLVEMPLIALIYAGFGSFFNQPLVALATAFLGGILLLFAAAGMLRGAGQIDIQAVQELRSPMVSGILVTLANPFCLAWWATVGATLILSAASYGPMVLGLFALLHWVCDILWYDVLSILSFKGGQFFGRRFQRIVSAGCGILLLFFGGRFIVTAIGLALAL